MRITVKRGNPLKGGILVKNRTKILISILAGFIVLLGCGVWLFQSLRSEPAPTAKKPPS